MTDEQRNLILSWKLLGFDFYTCVAAIVLKKKPADITEPERNQGKTTAYLYLYG